jgi:OmcA/MtrC family decaheme c-type cytochrome
MKWHMREMCLSTLIVLGGCGGGGGGGGGSVTTTTVSSTAGTAGAAAGSGSNTGAYADAEMLRPFVTAAEVPADGRVLVDFQLTNQDGVAITDLTGGDFRLTVAKLGFSELGNNRGNWQNYINKIEMPGAGPGMEPRLQATHEQGSDAALTNNSDGTYRYKFAASITSITDQAVLDQAAAEGLDLSYEPTRSHRVGIEFRNAQAPSNTTFDWIPDTGVTQLDGIFRYDVVAIENCNTCHQQLALHGGNRIETRYCVTCHNPGSADANSGNTVSFRNMIHKIHFGPDLPSVQTGTPYVLYGSQDRPVDYSNIRYPNDHLSCEYCHAGNSTGDGTVTETDAGDNWAEFATQEACGSCHDDVDFSIHFGGQPDDSNCMSCHRTEGVAGSIAARHENLVFAASERFEGQVLSIRNTMQGEFPEVQFAIVDPTSGDTRYDILSDPVWTQPSDSTLVIDFGWSTSDYTNTGNMGNNASAVAADALASATPVGDGSFIVTSPVAIPDGSLAPNVAANGSGAVVIEGHPAVDVGTASAPDLQRVPLTAVVDFFSINESSGNASPRRDVVELESCLACHGKLVKHGSNRTDNIQACVVCHNPRNTDKRVRDVAATPPTDGKDEESIHFTTMVHGIHASRFRDEPLQIVGFGGFSTHTYDGDRVQFPGELENCLSCHREDTYVVPLPATALGTTFDTGADAADPADDRVVSPTAAVCASCHDATSSRAHIESNGGNFDTTQSAIDSGLVVEQCEICHGTGRTVDVGSVHDLQ